MTESNKERYHWSRHDDTRIRLWKANEPGDHFRVMDLANFELVARQLQLGGHEVLAGMPDNEDGAEYPDRRFTRVVARIMTADEARAQCAEMGLNDRVTEFVVVQFENMHDRGRHADWCDCGSRPEECERRQAGNGRIACGQSWEHVLEELAEAFGVADPRFVVENDREEYPEIHRAWDAFFAE